MEMAMEDGNPAAAEKIRAVLDKVMNRPSSASLQFLTPGCQDRWSWSDALFMSPPVFVKLAAYTGDRRYLEFMDREYKLTCDYLFDREEGLFFRDSRYFTVPAANGKKMFWSRGNGWVIAGLPLILQDMPADWPSRPFYEDLLKRLAAALKKCQSSDGSWHASLLEAPSADVCFSRPVPERLDDFAWENDLTAHRIYGPAVARPAPEGEGLVSSGTDVWSKRAGAPVINEFYKRGDYHRDHGRGLDMYNVGPGRGCGGIAVFRDGKPHVSGNWASARTLYNGPVQTAFEVVYAPWDIGGGVRVAETRRVTLDAGNRFSKVRSVLNVRGAETVKAGVGMDTGKRRNDYEAVMEDRESGGLMTAWSRPRKDDGCLGTAVIVPWVPEGRAVDAEGCTYLLRKVANGEPFEWYMGAVWDKASPIRSAAGWEAEARRVRECIGHPLQVRVR